MKNTAHPGSIDAVLDRLLEFVVLGKAHLAIGRGISDKASNDPALTNTTPAFWGLTLTAHFDIAQLIAFKLFDPRRGTMTIEYLLSECEHRPNEFRNGSPSQVNAAITIARTQIANLNAPLKPIRAKRNRIIAHTDPTLVTNPEALARQVQVTISDLNQIFGTSGLILNEINLLLRDTTSVLELIQASDYESLFTLIEEAKCAQIKAYETEFNQRWPYPKPRKCS